MRNFLKTLDKTVKKCCLALIIFSMRGAFINTRLLTSILQCSNELITSDDFLSTDLRTWNDFHIYAIDGSTIQIPESEENYKIFGGNPNKTQIVSPLASVSVLYDVMNDILVDVSLHSYRYNERESAQSHIDFLPGFPNSILLVDRGYPSESMFRYPSIIEQLRQN